MATPDRCRCSSAAAAGAPQRASARSPGFYGWIRDWDTGGTYTDTVPCPDCQGKRLRPEYLAVTLSGCDISALEQMPLAGLAETLAAVALPSGEAALAGASLAAAAERLGFLKRVGLGYLHLSRSTCTLSAGEAQRIKLAGLLGSGLTSLTVLLDEPTRGLHPAEVEALLGALESLRDEGNTVIVVEHDPAVIRAADVIVELGPGAGAAGGRIVSQGTPAEVAAACTAGANTVGANTTTGAWLRGERRIAIPAIRRAPRGWLTIHGARANNLRGDEVRLPLGVLVGVCGVSGSGKSTLVIDTLARALAPVKHTTSVAREPIAPGAHDAIEGAPSRTLIVDQSCASAGSPIDILGLSQPLRRLYVESADARARGLGEAHFARTCSACGGKGAMRIDMGFLPAVYVPCETCRQSGCLPEAWDVRLRGLALPELLGRTIDEAYGLWQDVAALARPLAAARDVGLGYLVLRQPGHALSGGEAQRLKIAGELRNAHSAPLPGAGRDVVHPGRADRRPAPGGRRPAHRRAGRSGRGRPQRDRDRTPSAPAGSLRLAGRAGPWRRPGRRASDRVRHAGNAGTWRDRHRAVSARDPGGTGMTWAALLLADPSPCLRRLVLVELLGRAPDDPEVQELTAA